ncbi:unnamed protein product [Colias eurytheme]|nr:unnamed protein product [Colias eurytheme]
MNKIHYDNNRSRAQPQAIYRNIANHVITSQPGRLIHRGLNDLNIHRTCRSDRAGTRYNFIREITINHLSSVSTLSGCDLKLEANLNNTYVGAMFNEHVPERYDAPKQVCTSGTVFAVAATTVEDVYASADLKANRSSSESTSVTYPTPSLTGLNVTT